MKHPYKIVSNRNPGLWQTIPELATGRNKPEQGTKPGDGVAAGSFSWRTRTLLCTTFLAGFFAILTSAAPARAATATWSNSASSTDWFTAENWIRSPGSYPVTGDRIYIGTNTSGAATSGTALIGSGNAQGNSLSLGSASGTTGELTLQQGASLDLAGSLKLGVSGTGSLNIAGGSVSAQGSFNIGESGTGHLKITAGGTLNTPITSTYANISYNAAAAPQSTVLIDGTGSQWITSSGVVIGRIGSGAVTVRNGGLLHLQPSNAMGLGLAGSVGATGSLTIDGPGSKVITSNPIYVGTDGIAHVSISNGATLESNVSRSNNPITAYDYLGQFSTANDIRAEGHVVVDGPNSSWISHKAIAVGYAGIGELTIRNGAAVDSANDAGNSVIGYSRITNPFMAPFAAHGEVLITGLGSRWTTHTLDMAAFNGAEAILTVTDGGTLKTTGSNGIRIGHGGHGVINIGAPSGQNPTSAGSIEAANILLVRADDSRLNFNHSLGESDHYTFAPSISGTGAVDILAGVTTLTGSNAYDGTTTVSGGTLKPGAGAAFSPASDFVVESAGTLDLSGISQTVASLSNAGLVRTSSSGAVATTLTVSGDYVNSGGELWISSQLGDDLSQTDKLIVTGNVSGVTTVTVTNSGGLGAPTTNGIRIIEVGGNSAANAFVLASPGSVSAGGFTYTLKQQNDGWYLVSQQAGPTPGSASQPIPMLPLPTLALLGGLMAAAGAYMFRRRRTVAAR